MTTEPGTHQIGGSAPTPAYESPRIVPAGNLRDLVAEGGSGILRMQKIEQEHREGPRR